MRMSNRAPINQTLIRSSIVIIFSFYHLITFRLLSLFYYSEDNVSAIENYYNSSTESVNGHRNKAEGDAVEKKSEFDPAS